MEDAAAFLDFMDMIAVDVLAPAIAMVMACAFPMGSVNVKLATPASTVPLLCVMSNAAFIVGFVIMEFVNSVVLTMPDTHARTAPCSYLVSQFAKMYW